MRDARVAPVEDPEDSSVVEDVAEVQIVVLDRVRDTRLCELVAQREESRGQRAEALAVGSAEWKVSPCEVVVALGEYLEAHVWHTIREVLVRVSRLAALELRVPGQEQVPRLRPVAVDAEGRPRVLEQDPAPRLVRDHRRDDVRPTRAEIRGELWLEALHLAARLEPDDAVPNRHAPGRRPRPVLLDLELASDVDVLACDPLRRACVHCAVLSPTRRGSCSWAATGSG